MANVNIVATRLDQRLLHGQATIFVKSMNANLVIVANDAASTDKLQQSLMKVCLSNDIGLRFFSIDQVIENINKAAPEQKIIIIVGNIPDVYKLVTNGVPITEINIGNIHAAAGKKVFNRFISLSDEEFELLKELKNKYNLSITNKGHFSDVTDSPINWEKILN